MKKLLLSAIFFIAISMNGQITMGLIGDGAGGWCDTCDLVLSSTDNTNYTRSNVVLTTGQLKFRQIIGGVGTWNSNEVGTPTQPGFPSGTGTVGGGSNIIPNPGTYNVSLNRGTGVYSFTSVVTFNSLNISGTAVGSNPINLSTTNGTDYSVRAINLTTGNLVLNQTSPTATTWSGTTFPAGTAVAGTTGIPVVAGRYNLAFNRSNGAYSFVPVIYTVIGSGVGGWADSNDIALTTSNGVNYTRPSITLVAGDIKFRENNTWSVNIGGTSFPSGTGILGDPNIAVTAGTYSVAFNRLDRVYNFTVLSNDNFVKYNFDFYPNPTNNVWNFRSVTNVLSAISVVDALGKTVINVTPNSLETTIDASSLSSGVYFARVTSDNKTQTVKLVKN